METNEHKNQISIFLPMQRTAYIYGYIPRLIAISKSTHSQFEELFQPLMTYLKKSFVKPIKINTASCIKYKIEIWKKNPQRDVN